MTTNKKNVNRKKDKREWFGDETWCCDTKILCVVKQKKEEEHMLGYKAKQNQQENQTKDLALILCWFVCWFSLSHSHSPKAYDDHTSPREKHEAITPECRSIITLAALTWWSLTVVKK